jgi:hypothetical protein
VHGQGPETDPNVITPFVPPGRPAHEPEAGGNVDPPGGGGPTSLPSHPVHQGGGGGSGGNTVDPPGGGGGSGAPGTGTSSSGVVDIGSGGGIGFAGVPADHPVAQLVAAVGTSLLSGGISAATPAPTYLKVDQPTVFTDTFGNRLVDRWWSLLSGMWNETTAGSLRTTSGGEIYFNTLSFANGYSSVVLENPTPEKGQGIKLRSDLVSGDGYEAALADDGGGGFVLNIFNRNGGNRDPLTAGAAVTFVDGDALKFEANGTTLTVYKNAVSVLSVVDATYASGYTGLRSDLPAGFRTYTNSTTL